MRPTRAVSTALLAVAGSFFVVILIRTAWMSDSAYLTLRTVEHVASGFGARWNVAERVQVFDHPLWFLLLLVGRWITGETYFATLGLSILCSTAAAWWLLRRASNEASAIFIVAALALSPLFMTFSTSGLETPLLHLFTVAIAIRAVGSGEGQGAPGGEDRVDRHRALAVMVGLAIVTRWTMAWIAVPAWMAVARKSRRRDLLIEIALMVVPLAMWSLWAWRYYGVLTPASWIADASRSLTWQERLSLGGSFLDQTLQMDPLLVMTIATGVAIGLWAGAIDRWLAVGAVMAVAWTIARGGSEMAGRDLTAPFLVAVVLIVRRLSLLRPIWAGAAATAAVIAGLAVYLPTYRSDGRFAADWRGTTRTHDPRLDDYQATALLLVNRPAPAPRDTEAERGKQAAAEHQPAAISLKPGMFGIAAGPSVYVLDPRGTVDPLIARLPPAVGARRQWGMDRRVPDDYLSDVTADRSTLSDAALAALDNELRQVTRAPLNAPGRLTLIRKLPGDAARLIAQSSYGPEHVTLDDVSQDAPRSIREGGVIIALPQRQPASAVDARFSGKYDYELAWLDGDAVVSRTKVIGSLTASPSLASRTIAPGTTAAVTSLWLRCGRGIGPCLVSTVRLVH